MTKVKGRRSNALHSLHLPRVHWVRTGAATKCANADDTQWATRFGGVAATARRPHQFLPNKIARMRLNASANIKSVLRPKETGCQKQYRGPHMTNIEQVRAAVTDPRYSHSRTRSWCRAEVTYIYHRDPASPSGVMLAAGGEASIVDPIIRELRNNSPLSPTEF